MRGALALLVAACLVSAVYSQGEGYETSNASLPAFTQVYSCAPFPIVITTGAPAVAADSNATAPSGAVARITAEKDVRDALSFNVQDGVLYVSAADSFSTRRPIKVQIAAPAGVNSVEVRSGATAVLASAGGTGSSEAPLDEIKLLAGGSGTILTKNVAARSIVIGSEGAGVIFAKGAFQNVSVAASGASQIYLLGVSKGVDVDLKGAAELAVQPADASVPIIGHARGLSKVHTAGSLDACKVEGGASYEGFFLQIRSKESSCMALDAADIPPLDADAAWACGLRVSGVESCKGEPTGTKDADKKDSEEDGDTLFSFVFPGLIDINVPRPDLGINTMLKLAPGGGALAIRRPCRDEPKTLKISQDV